MNACQDNTESICKSRLLLKLAKKLIILEMKITKGRTWTLKRTITAMIRPTSTESASSHNTWNAFQNRSEDSKLVGLKNMVHRNHLSTELKKSQKNPKVTNKTQAKSRRNRTRSLRKKKPTKGHNQGLLGLQQGSLTESLSRRRYSKTSKLRRWFTKGDWKFFKRSKTMIGEHHQTTRRGPCSMRAAANASRMTN